MIQLLGDYYCGPSNLTASVRSLAQCGTIGGVPRTGTAPTFMDVNLLTESEDGEGRLHQVPQLTPQPRHGPSQAPEPS